MEGGGEGKGEENQAVLGRDVGVFAGEPCPPPHFGA